MQQSPIEIAKAALREKAKAQRAELGSSDRVEAAKSAAGHFKSGVEVPGGAIISAYWPIRDEIDCRPVLAYLMDSFRTVCLPVIVGDEVPLQFRVWEQGESLFEAGFGSLAPADTARVAEPDLVIIPLLGFDKSGARLGYGRGHYDRSIGAMAKKPVLIGYAFAAQELTEIPQEPHDVPLDILVTENGVRRFRS